MKETKVFFVFTTITDGKERITIHPIAKVPLIYLSRKAMEEDHITEYLQSMADTHGISFKLQQYILNDTILLIEPMKTRVTQ